MIKLFTTALLAQPGKTAIVLLLVLFLLAADYFSRLYTPIPEAKVANFDVLTLQANVTSTTMTQPMQRWLAQLSTSNETMLHSTDDAQQAENKAQLIGATTLDNMQLVVRATFISSMLNQRFALIQVQTDNEPAQYITAFEQQAFGRYLLKHIDVHQLRFIDQHHAEQPVIIVPVFAGVSKLQQGLNDAPEN